MKKIFLISLVFLCFLTGAAWKYNHHIYTFPKDRDLPSRNLTPGRINPNVNQSDIYSTICVKGFTKMIRPPERYTERLKGVGIKQYRYSHKRYGDFEEDHLISLELGGSPTSPKNLWPEPWKIQGGWGAGTKDKLENKLNHLVCDGKITLKQAQYDISHNWIATYKKYMR